MFDFIKNLRKSEAKKRQEAITAYLDDALTAGERQRLEQQMAADPTLRADMEQQRLVKLNVSRLPQVRAPRNFTLDPALFGRPARQSNARLYPAMRVATVLVGVFFIIAVGAEILTFDGRASETSSIAEQIVGMATAEDALMDTEAETVLEAEPADDLAAAPRTGIDIDEVIPEREEAVEEEQPQEAPVESLGAAADEDVVEGEDAAEESFAVTVVTAAAEAAAEKNAVAEAEAESAPTAPMPAEEQGEIEGAPPAEADDGQADLPLGDGGEPEESPRPGVLMTEVADRAALAATEMATSMPTLTPSADVEPGQAPEEVVAETPGEAVTGEPEALPVQGGPAASQDDSTGLPTLQVVILLLGITLILLAAVTLITRWQLKG